MNRRLVLRREVPHLRIRTVEEWVVRRRLGVKKARMLTFVLRRVMLILRMWMLMLMGKVSRWCH